MKRAVRYFLPVLATAISVACALPGCGVLGRSYTKYTDTFFDTFDTYVTVVAYARNQSRFDAFYGKVRERFLELHKLYDIYNAYEGINNLKTVNDSAGIKPIEVDNEIIDLILFAKEWHAKTGGRTNIAMGSVLRLWHEYRQEGLDDPDRAQLPPNDMLQEAANHTDIDKVVVDLEARTVFLSDAKMSLDVGAVAKGYATEVVSREARALGIESAFISSGGNIKTIGKPLDGLRERWGIGIQDPDKSVFSEDEDLVDVVYGNDIGVASSGDYQRYYVVDGRAYHHIIDPGTLMPATFYRAVTVVAPGADVADFMSTAAFLLPYEESRTLLDSIDGVEALWIMPDGEVLATEGMKTISRSSGASGATSG